MHEIFISFVLLLILSYLLYNFKRIILHKKAEAKPFYNLTSAIFEIYVFGVIPFPSAIHIHNLTCLITHVNTLILIFYKLNRSEQAGGFEKQKF